jgi:predicted amidohydrolase YtcJ
MSVQFTRHLLGVIAIALTAGWLQAQQPATMVLHNGKILTVDNSMTVAQAIALRGNQIAAVGTDAQVMALPRAENAVVVDLKGRTVIPGLIHTHIHINDEAENNYGGYIGFEGMKAYPIAWGAVRTVQDALNQVRGVMEKYKFAPGEWVYFGSASGGGGGSGGGGAAAAAQTMSVMLDGMNRYELDKVTPNNPVVMGFTWPNVNGVLVNSKAIDIIWPEHGNFFKTYGRYWIDQRGQPEGHLESPGLRWALEKLPEPEPPVVAGILKMMNDEQVAEGITTISTRLPVYAEAAFKWMETQGLLNVRMAYGFETYFGRMDGGAGLKEAGAQMGKGSDWVWPISAAPSAIDGSGARMCVAASRVDTASSLDKWWGGNGQCLQDIEYKGPKGAPISGNYFREFMEMMARDGARLANTHAAGDRSVKLTMNLMEQMQQRYGKDSTKAWALDHCRLVDPTDMPRAAQLGLMFSCEFSLGGEEAVRTYGEKVAHSYPSPAKTMLKNNIIVANEMGGFQGLETSITRKDRNGKVWAPQERLTREEALIVSIRNGAYYTLRGDKLGSLEVGKLADLVVLDKDYMTIPEDDIGELKALWTIVDGKPVFADPTFVAENGRKVVGTGTLVSTLDDLRLRRKSQQGIARR